MLTSPLQALLHPFSDQMHRVLEPGEGADVILNHLHTGIDALVVLPFESEPLTSPVKAVADQGIWVTVVDRGLSQEGIEDLYVAGDNPGFGKVAGEYMAKAMGDPGDVALYKRAFGHTSTESEVCIY